MAAENTFPQLPSTVWKGVWSLLRKSPTRKLDDSSLAAELNVQQTAARQYLKEIVRLGILAEDGTPTELAGRWRQDGDDQEVITEILQQAYPESLLQLAPMDDLDRDKIVRWFLGQQLGEGSAKNKAATYIRIAQGISALDAPPRGATTPSQTKAPAAKRSKPATTSAATRQEDRSPLEGQRGQTKPDLNVNIQIHISADASAEQIDAIFAGMRKYFD